MDTVIFWAFTAAAHPTLLAASTVMLLLDHPKRLLLGYLCGALFTSLTLGMIIVFAVDGSSGATSTAQSTLAPAMDLTRAGLLLLVPSLIRPSGVPKETGRL